MAKMRLWMYIYKVDHGKYPHSMKPDNSRRGVSYIRHIGGLIKEL